jgi:flagellar motor switch protein FliN/FliY
MAGDQLDPDELNQLGAGAAQPGDAGAAGALGQNEVEALLKAAVSGNPNPKANPAHAEKADGGSSAQHADNDMGMASGDVEYLLQQAELALASVNEPDRPASDLPVKPFRLQDFSGAPPSSEAATLALIREVELDVKIELGRTQMFLDDVLKLHKGSVVALDKLAGDPVDIFVNGRLIARGEVLVLNDNFCVRVAELITGETTP